MKDIVLDKPAGQKLVDFHRLVSIYLLWPIVMFASQSLFGSTYSRTSNIWSDWEGGWVQGKLDTTKNRKMDFVIFLQEFNNYESN